MDSPGIAAQRADHLKVLGLKKDAPEAALRAAYLGLAKKWHPDRNSRPSAAAKFQKLTEAYRALTRPAIPEWDVALVPLQCSRCGESSPSLRHISYTTVISFLLLSWRKRSSGIFCTSCARAVSIRASAVSGLLGWWSIQGPFLTPLAVIRNIRGGEMSEAINLRLLCHNFLAFQSRGETKAARVLANNIVQSGRGVAAHIVVAMAELERSTREDDRDRPVAQSSQVKGSK
jgi:hypothetical protein